MVGLLIYVSVAAVGIFLFGKLWAWLETEREWEIGEWELKQDEPSDLS